MRVLAVPAALLLALCLYLPFPAAQARLHSAMRRAYAAVARLYTRKSGQTDELPALLTFLLLLIGGSTLLCAVHPLLSMLLIAPSFTGLTILPDCAKTKDELDSGRYASDIPAYEAIVRRSCASLAPAFAGGVAAPLMLGCLGMPLHLGAPLCLSYTALCALEAQLPAASRAASAMRRFSGRVLVFFLLLCSGAVGRNPFHTKGRRIEERLLSILGIAGGSSDTHAPMAGDIPQGIFLCGFAVFILGFTCCIAGLALCR